MRNAKFDVLKMTEIQIRLFHPQRQTLFVFCLCGCVLMVWQWRPVDECVHIPFTSLHLFSVPFSMFRVPGCFKAETGSMVVCDGVADDGVVLCC